MKMKITALVAALVLTLNAYSQFFDTVPFRGAFGISGSTRPATTAYNPDPTNTGADWTKPWANWTPNATSYPGDAGWTPTAAHPAASANKVSVSGDIANNTTWTKNNWYEVSGTVHVLNGATLTIEPGTVIRGNASNVFVLIVAKGGKINAIGTKEQPIVFTSGKAAGSRVRGDWGGMLLIGNAHTNTQGGVRQYEALPSDPLTNYGGGTNYNDADNSGTIRYVRIEYAGYNFLPDQEINGLTFAGVGSGTHADYIQVSYANDDSYEWFGGASNHKYLIAFAGTDDDFDMDEGYNGKLQYLLGVRNPAVFETSPSGTSNGLEHDNNTGLGTAGQVTPGVNAPEPKTAPIISNMTLLGPIRAGETRNSLSSTARARFGRALEMRTNVSTSIFNSLIGGYNEGLRMVHPSTSITPSVQQRALNDEMTMRANILASAIPTDLLYTATNTPTGVTFNVATWWFNGATSGLTTSDNDTATTVAKFGITSPGYAGNAGGSLSQIDFSSVDFTLTNSSLYRTSSRFNTAKTPTTPQPSISVNPTSLPVFNQVVGTPSDIKWIVVNAANLGGNLTFNAPSNFELSFSRTSGWASSINKNGPSANDTVFIRYNRSNTGSSSGFISVTSSVSADFSPININVSGSATAPASPFLTVSKSQLTFTSALSVASAEQTFMVVAKYVTGNVNITAPAGFELSQTSGTGFASSLAFTPTNGNVDAMVYVRYTPASTSTVNDTIKINATNLDQTIIRVIGSTPTASLSVSPSGYGEWQIITGDSSIAYPITISGTNLTDSVRVNAPNTNFQLSLDSAFTVPSSVLYLNITEAATLASTKVYVRFKGATASGNVTVTSSGATTRNVAVAGRAVSNSTRRIVLSSSTNTLNFETTFGTPSAAQSIKVSAANLTDSLGIAFSIEGFQLSLNQTTWSNYLRIDTLAGKVINETTVYIRYNPTTVGATGAQQLLITSPSATGITLNISGQSTPAVTATPAVLPVLATVLGKPSISVPVSVSGSRLLSDITVTATTGFQVSTDSITGFTSMVTLTKTGTTLSSTKVFVRYNPTTAGNAPLNSALNIATQSSPGAIITLSGYAVLAPTPVLTLSTANLNFNTNTAGATAAQSFTVSATNLQDSLSISVGGDFELSPDSVNYNKTWKLAGDANGSITNLKLFCRFNRSTSGNSSDSIVFSSTAMSTQKITVNGLNNVGLKEVNNISQYLIYPNPTREDVNIAFTLLNTAQVNITVMDITGKIVKEISNEFFNKGNNQIQFSVADLTNGLYFISMESANGTKTSRLVVVK